MIGAVVPAEWPAPIVRLRWGVRGFGALPAPAWSDLAGCSHALELFVAVQRNCILRSLVYNFFAGLYRDFVAQPPDLAGWNIWYCAYLNCG